MQITWNEGIVSADAGINASPEALGSGGEALAVPLQTARGARGGDLMAWCNNSRKAGKGKIMDCKKYMFIDTFLIVWFLRSRLSARLCWAHACTPSSSGALGMLGMTQPRAPFPAQADPTGGHRAEVAVAAAGAPISLPPWCAGFEGKLGEEAGVTSQARAPQLHFVQGKGRLLRLRHPPGRAGTTSLCPQLQYLPVQTKY